jgi:hypothetical protein
MKKLSLSNLLSIVLILGSFSAFSQEKVSQDDGLDGVWQNTKVLCRYPKKQQEQQGSEKFNYYEGKIIDTDPKVFYPDVELKISTIVKEGKVPERYLEKAVIQSSCKLNKDNVQVYSSGHPYIWSKNKINLKPFNVINGVTYHSMTGKLVDSKINYSDINSCGAEQNVLNIKITLVGLISSFGTFLKYDFPVLNKSYFNQEAARQYAIYRHQQNLYLEFKDEDICKNQGTAVMVFDNKL